MFYDIRRPWEKIGYKRSVTAVKMIGHFREEILEIIVDIDVVG